MKRTYFDSDKKTDTGTGFNITDDEFEDLKSDYSYQFKSNNGKRGAMLAKTAGVILLILAGLFFIQQFFLPVGPALDSFIRLFSIGGAIVVIIFGLGLLSRQTYRNKRRQRPRKNIMDSGPDFFAFDTKSSEDSSSGRGTGRGSMGDSGNDNRSGTWSGSMGDSGNDNRSGTESGSMGDSGNDNRSGTWSNYHDFGKSQYRRFENMYDEYAYSNSKRWYRSRNEKMLFGVCGGIAERFEIDPTIVRAIFALAFFSYGFSLLIYIILAVVLPKRPVQSLL